VTVVDSRTSRAGEAAAAIWDASGWPAYYETHRRTTKEVYPSEWFFLKDALAEGLSVLDVGCALGGLASVLSEHLQQFEYTGVDISEEMIQRARHKHPRHRFEVIHEADLSVLGGNKYDLVVCFGVLHLSRGWRDLVAAAWERANKSFLLDLRESHLTSIEDQTVSYFRVDHLLGTGASAAAVLPYNVINSAEARGALIELCAGAGRLQHYGYLSPPSEAAVTPAKDVFMNTYRIDRR
jgi:SAM-dependent methyltransferase